MSRSPSPRVTRPFPREKELRNQDSISTLPPRTPPRHSEVTEVLPVTLRSGHIDARTQRRLLRALTEEVVLQPHDPRCER